MPAEPGFRFRRSLTSEDRHGRQRVVSLRRRSRRKLGVTVLVILLLVPAGLLAVRSLWTALTTDMPESEVAGIAAPAVPDLDPSNPFDKTPADGYLEGAQGIVDPPATALGPWKAAEVQKVLDTTRTLLLLARTDPAVLAGNPTKYLAALAVNTRRPAAAEIKKGAPALGYVTRLAPGDTLAAPVRTKGRLLVALGRDKQLVITADVVWVYPLAGARATGAPKVAGARLVVLRTVETYQWYPQKGFSKQDQGLRPGAGEQAVYNVDCEGLKAGLIGLPGAGSGPVTADGMRRALDLATRPSEFPANC
ncbi:MAG TPA: hypothetical protein VGR21_04100 [Cryptosporangiaceae bacterium]|nr:hypothetical protein [Cryptosporangiaceae bacterium]